MKFKKIPTLLIIFMCSLIDFLVFSMSGRPLIFAQYANYLMLLWLSGPFWALFLSGFFNIALASVFGAYPSQQVLLLIGLSIIVRLLKSILQESTTIIFATSLGLLVFIASVYAPLYTYPVWSVLSAISLGYALFYFYGRIKVRT